MVYQLIYTSIATPALDDFALREIAQSSSYNNQLLGLTGLLLFDSRSILQVIEGDEMSVYSLYGKVKRDKRHTHCQILNAGMGQNREFLDTFMGYKNVTGHPDADALFNLNQNNFRKVLPFSPPHELEGLTPSYQKAG
ncbi:MAG: BLUF domain-containing protein [Hellea sp.]